MVQAPPGPWTTLPWFMAAIPATRPELLERPRVEASIDRSTQAHPLTVVSAPSGYGKTTAVAAWARGRDDVVWVSASAATDSFTVVRGCLLEALSPAVQFQLASREPEEPAPNPLDLIGRMSEPKVLVIDDAHLLDAAAVRHTITSEAALASGLVRVLLIGQPKLERSFARELSTGLATTISGRELAFSIEEIEALISLGEDNPKHGSAEELLRSSGGWPVVVRLLMLGGANHASEPWDREGVWDHLASDYVEDAVLGQLTEDFQTFVLEAATAGRTTASLVQQLTGREDSASLLAQCRRYGLFIESFQEPGQEEIYRWHDTFVSLARTIRMRRDPNRCRSLHRMAAEALTRDYPGAAVEQALLADDPTLAVDIIRATWLGLLLSSQATALDQLCQTLPERLQDDPDILLIRACCCDILGDQKAASLLRRRAEAVPGASHPRSEFVQSFTDLYLLSDPVEKALAADRAHEVLAGVGDTHAIPHAVYLLGWVELRLRRDPERAVESLISAVRLAQAQGLTDLAARAQANLAFALTYGGRFAQADAALDAVDVVGLANSDWEIFDGGLTLFSRGYIHFYRGQLTEAFHCFDRMVREGGNDGSFLGLGRVYFALSASALGRDSAYDEAEYNLSLVSNHDRHGVPWESYKRLAAVRLLEARGKPDAARELAEPLLNRSGLPVVHSLLAEFYRRQGEPALAHASLARIERQSRPRYTHVSALVTTAALSAGRGRHDDAHRFIERALLVAAPDAAWFPFLARDSDVTHLLDSHPRSGHTETILAEISRIRTELQGSPGQSLTTREQEILHYLRTSMTTLEIAQELHLSPNTVKTHLRAIYRKLDVPNRRSAVRLMS